MLLVVAAAIVWWLLAGTGQDSGTGPENGLPVVQVADLPSEAADILALIDRGGPFEQGERLLGIGALERQPERIVGRRVRGR